ncbi:Uu.00g016810.m01.CDS01 [Anthostomella pinea]|uniref:Uu.00g016810.m01.CDS01 n=1 Tax=Anthostomella pinea TaxID=933095 RepID=A0AAI8YNB4_9PEZI|nr:Uu.00g016810.m01.CDS01 [Anthostomella pinea]
MADTATAPAAPAAAAAGEKKRPEKPNLDLFNERLAKAEKEYQDSFAKYNAIKAKVELAVPNKNKDAPTPTQKRRQELIAQANEIRNKQGAGKNTRNSKMDQIKRLDEQLRSRIAEQKSARGKVNFRSVEDLDREIENLDKQVNSGMMKLVDEKKALTEISNLRKQRKHFAQFDTSQKGIDELKAKIKEIKDSMDDPENRALSEQYTKIQAEIDSIKAEQDEAFKNLNSLRDERSKLQAEQQEKFQAVRKLKDEYYGAKKAHAEYEREARQKVRERQKADREKFDKEKKKERAQKMLQEASDPAYLEEIRRANSLLHFFDPSSTSSEKAPLLAESGLSAQASRKVEDSAPKGTKLLRKEDRDDEYAPAVKKGKKGKKGGAAAAGKSTYNCPPSVIDDCGFMGIDPPMSAADVPAAAEKVKAKLEHWKSDQKAQTERNVEKAKKEIEALEAEEAGDAPGTATPNGVDGDKKADDKVADVTSDLKDASLEEKKE